MARIIETYKEHEVFCPHCGKKIGFTIDDVWSSYENERSSFGGLIMSSEMFN